MKQKKLKSQHKLVQSIDGRKAIYCSPGHIVGIVNLNSEQEELIKFLSSHQIKKDFLYSFGWKKGDIAYGQIVLCFMRQLHLTVTEKCLE